jgi:hypothetical protein
MVEFGITPVQGAIAKVFVLRYIDGAAILAYAGFAAHPKKYSGGAHF